MLPLPEEAQTQEQSFQLEQFPSGPLGDPEVPIAQGTERPPAFPEEPSH